MCFPSNDRRHPHAYGRTFRVSFRTFVFAGGLLAAIATCRAQVPPISTSPQTDAREELRRAMDAGAYREARAEQEEFLGRAPSPRERADLLYATIETAMRGEEYAGAYELTSVFLAESPHDRRAWDIVYDRGLSAYHLAKIDTTVAALNAYLSVPSNEKRTEALYWRGMADLERAEWGLAESDFQDAYNDTISEQQRDKALLGWSLALEHRGDIPEAARLLERLLTDYPQSDVLTDATLRLASLTLQEGKPERAIALLAQSKPKYRSQREESQLLHGEANLQLGMYDGAETDFKNFLARYPSSPFLRNALSGLAWSYQKKGETAQARKMFDSLGTWRDTLSLGAMYQSGVIALLAGNTADGASALEALIEKSPYDVYSDRAYYLLGLTDYRARRYLQARKDFRLVARLFPESPFRIAAYRMAGEAGMALSDFGNAQFDFGQVRRLGAPDTLLAPALFQEGICLYHLGRFKTSGERLGEFLRRYPDDRFVPDALVWRGEALYQDGRFAEAENAYREALRRSPDDVKRMQAAYGIAWSLFEEKKFSQAGAAFDKFTHEYPKSDHVLDASLRRADCYLFMREFDKAQELYSSLSAAKNSNRNTEYAAFQLAMSYIQRGENLRGIEQLRDFLVRFPNSIYDEVVQFNIGWTFFTMEQYPPAIIELRRLAQQFPQSQLMPRVLFNLGDAFYNTKDYDSARVYYQAVIDRFPSSALVKDAVSGLRFTYEAQGKSREALSTIDKYMGATPNAGMEQDLLLNKADILFGQGDLNGARDQYQKVLALKPEKNIAARVYQQIGRISELNGDTLSAISDYQRILKDFSETETAPAAALALGSAYTRTRRYTDAVGVLQEFSPKYPSSPLGAEAQYDLGIAYRSMPDREKARGQFVAIIQQRPADVFADRSRMQIANIDSGEKEYKRAIDTLEVIVSHRSDDIAAEALLMMGDCYMALKKYVDALQSYKDVIEQYTDFPLLIERGHLGAGRAYERLRDRKHARSEYGEVVKSAHDATVTKEAEDRLRRLRK